MNKFLSRVEALSRAITLADYQQALRDGHAPASWTPMLLTTGELSEFVLDSLLNCDDEDTAYYINLVKSGKYTLSDLQDLLTSLNEAIAVLQQPQQ